MHGATLLLAVLPFALGAGWAPTILGTQVLLLASGEGAVARTWALAIGRSIGVVILAFVGVQLLSLLPDFKTGGPSWWQVLILVIAGAALAVATAIEYRNRHKPHKSGQKSSRLSKLSPWWVLPVGLFGFTLQVTPLFVPGLHVITTSDANDFWHIVALIELIVLACWLSFMPPLAVTIWGDRATPKLQAFHAFMIKESHPLLIGITALGSVFLFAVAFYQMWQLS